MTDAPQAPYDDEGDARPVSLIGAKISSVRDAGTQAEGAGGFDVPGSAGADDRRGAAQPGAARRPAGRRGRRRKGDHHESADPGLTDTQAFLLGGGSDEQAGADESEPAAPSHGDEVAEPAPLGRPEAKPATRVPTRADQADAARSADSADAVDSPDAGNPASPAEPGQTGQAGGPAAGTWVEIPSAPSDGDASKPAPARRDGPRPAAGRDLGPTTFPRAPVPRPPAERPGADGPPTGRPDGARPPVQPPAPERPAPERPAHERPAGGDLEGDHLPDLERSASEEPPTEYPPDATAGSRVDPADLPPFGAPLGSTDTVRHRRPRDAGRPAAVPPRQPLVPAVPAPAVASSAELDRRASAPWPWQEPFSADVELEPWEEIPVREALVDRAAAVLGSSRRIAVVSLTPGVGRTTVTAAAGLELAGARREAVVAVDTAAEPSPEEPAWSAPLASRVGIAPTGNARVLVAARADLSSFGDVRRLVGGSTGAVGGDWSGDDEVLAGWPESGSYGEGLDVLPVRGLERDGLTPLDLRDLNGALADLGSWYPLVLVDCPPGLDDTVTSAVLTDADAVVLVTRATPADLHEAAVAAAALKTRTGGDGGAGSRVVVAVTSLRSGRWSPRTRAAASALAGHVSGLVRIPYDPALTGYGTIRGPRSRRRTRKAFLRLAATIVETCATADTRQPAAVAGAVRREIG